ncbi:wings apart-like protein 1 isoform X2 [Amaranthus tricolor]|uniref:wings apart-like protein 1 isoform X2 n=1 Tax=Amaranthus tricolor TaxID=29722 RepID=UPI002585DEAB|nr:wings apart-like protein 1 isoform X2 [Amaranthus tricolor]
MIVRTYGRRKIGRTFSNSSFNDSEFLIEDYEKKDEDPFAFSEPTNSTASTSYSLSQFKEQREIGNFSFSSQDSSRWVNSESENDTNSNYKSSLSSLSLQLLAPKKKARKLNNGRREKKREKKLGLMETTSLMETQEYGEMMECIDEVEFALDGLKGGKGIRVRRSSLLSLLNVCGIPQQRRLLKAQGMTKAIVDAFLNLSLDDPPSNLAAATLFYILTSDGQDSYLLDSFSSIRFLLKLLKPIVADTASDNYKAPSISQKLLALRKDMLLSLDLRKRADSSAINIAQKVLETLVTCKDLKASNIEDDDILRPELNANWISLLTMEKACLSTIAIEDASGTVRRTGGNFKEKLRELGGLDAVFELTINFHSTLEGSVEPVRPSSSNSKDGKLQCLPLLLKCFKILENATFLSEENQNHLLGLKGNLAAGQGSSLSFVKLMTSLIKILSELSLRKTTHTNSSQEIAAKFVYEMDCCPAILLNAGQRVHSNRVSSMHSSQECSSSGRYLSDSDLRISQSSQRLSSSQSGSLSSNLSATTKFGVGSCLLEKAASISAIKNSIKGAPVNGHISKTTLALSKSPYDDDNDMFIDLDDSQDPFAFDEDDYASSRWESHPGRQRVQHNQNIRPTFSDAEDECLMLPMLSQEGSASQPMLHQEDFGSEEQTERNHILSDISCTTIDEESFSLVSECLLTAIKVLMNLTNDNDVGCQKIANCGGLELLSCLIARHFPLFSLLTSGKIKGNTLFIGNALGLESQKDIHLNDQELLVTILGLLVNMVENDGDNRSRLAAAEVPLHNSGYLQENHTGVLSLLCSVFLANRGAGEATEEDFQSLALGNIKCKLTLHPACTEMTAPHVINSLFAYV